MKEKVIILSNHNGLGGYKAETINGYLGEGWTVKSVNMSSEKDYTTAIFVLQKKEN